MGQLRRGDECAVTFNCEFVLFCPWYCLDEDTFGCNYYNYAFWWEVREQYLIISQFDKPVNLKNELLKNKEINCGI